MKKIAIILSLLLTVIIFTDSFSQPKDRRQFRDNIKEKLNLSEEQQEKIETLKIQHQKEMVDLKASLEKEKIAMKELKQNTNFSRTDYISAVERLNEIKNQIAVKHANHRMDVYELLDDNQKEEWLKSGDRFEGKHMMGENRMMKKRRF